MFTQLTQTYFRFIIILTSIILIINIKSMPSLANTPITVLVQLTPGTDPVQLSVDYQTTLLRSIDSLSIYQLEGTDSQLIANLLADSRVVAVQEDSLINSIETQQLSVSSTMEEEQFIASQTFIIDADTFIIDADSGDTTSPSNRLFSSKTFIIDADNGNQPNLKELLWNRPFTNDATKIDQVETDLNGWHIRKIRTDQAHDRVTGDANVTVAVIDTGVDLDHPALVGQLVSGYDFVDDDATPDDAPNFIDDDGDGMTDEAAGHGTHVAGIVAQLAPDVSIMPIRALNTEGSGYYSDLIASIIYAVDNNAQIINLSLSGPHDTPLLKAAIDYAHNNNVIVVAAGGAFDVEYPARYSEVISVGAVDEQNNVAYFSDFATGDVSVYAPGVGIFSTFHSGGYAWWTGTSMATPMVSAEAALLLSTGNCDNSCVRTTIEQETHPVTPSSITRGRIDLFEAVKTFTNP